MARKFNKRKYDIQPEAAANLLWVIGGILALILVCFVFYFDIESSARRYNR